MDMSKVYEMFVKVMEKGQHDSTEKKKSMPIYYKGFSTIVSPNETMTMERISSLWIEAKQFFKKKDSEKVTHFWQDSISQNSIKQRNFKFKFEDIIIFGSLSAAAAASF